MGTDSFLVLRGSQSGPGEDYGGTLVSIDYGVGKTGEHRDDLVDGYADECTLSIRQRGVPRLWF